MGGFLFSRTSASEPERAIMSIFSRLRGRNRRLLSSPENRSVLSKVIQGYNSHAFMSSLPFDIRQAVADALKNNGFDDAGIGCKQELELTSFIAQACGFTGKDQALVPGVFQTKSVKELKDILGQAVRYA